ncbi:hypothetical protein DM790_24805 [Flavobacterium collinsii]|nr:hypothetical protein [Flavobacterium collinsii]
MITYGHEKFIEEAIKGVLMQEVDFDLELIIANDASPDKTDEIVISIVQNHPRGSWIKYIKHETNIGMMQNFKFSLESSKGKYIAMCEGDDYWTDPLKLQKQVDFLEANKQASGCFHHASLIDEEGKIINEIYNSHVSDLVRYNQKECLTILGSSYATCTLLFKSEVLQDLPKVLVPVLCDELLDIVITEKGLLYFLNFNGANYRFHSGGIWSGRKEAKFNLIMYKRTEALYKYPIYKKRYSSYLKMKMFLQVKGFVFSNDIKTKTRVLYFFKTLKILNYYKKETYLFFMDFIISILQIKKRFRKQYA